MKPMKQLWELVKYKPWLYIANIITWTIVELIPLLPILIIREILDSFTGNTGLDNRFWWLIVLTVLMYFLQILFVYAGVIVGVLYNFHAKSLLIHNLLKSLFKRPGAVALNMSSGEALSRFRDDVTEAIDVLDWPPDIVGKALRAFIAIVVMATIDIRITYLVILPLLVVSAIVQQVRKKVYKYREASRAATSGVVGAMGEIFGAVQAIQVAGAEESILSYFERLNKKRHNTMLKDTLFVKVVGAVLNNVVHLGTGLILLLSARAMQQGSFTIGDFALFINYWFLVANLTQHFGGMLASYQQAKVSFKRLWDFLQDTPADELVRHEEVNMIGKVKEEKSVIEEKRPIEELKYLEVKDLSHYFSNEKTGIKKVNFSVEKGSFTVITGRIASGKSTLVKALLGLLPLQDGTILWNGKPVEDPSSFFIPPYSSYTGQTPHLFSDTVRNNILFGQEEIDEVSIKRTIYSAVMEEDINTLEKGLDTVIGPRGVKLSGGQQQRVAAARMFANRSQLYVFDDISSALDVETEATLWSRLLEKRDATCIAISNRPTALEMADQILVMKEGEMIAKGTLEELLETCSELQQIYGQKLQAL